MQKPLPKGTFSKYLKGFIALELGTESSDAQNEPDLYPAQKCHQL